MKFTQIPTNTFKEIQLNAGILCTEFAPATGEVTGLIGATTGGVNFTDTPEYVDFGEDIDNCPKNTLELKKIDSREVKLSGTFVTITPTAAHMLAGAADVDGSDSTHIIPRDMLEDSDFAEQIWWVGDYSDKNGENKGGYVAVKLKNALNTSGFQIQSKDKGKGQFAFEFTGHYSMDDIDEVPYEVYVKAGTAETTTGATGATGATGGNG